MPYETVFRAPLEIADGQATISWLNNDKGFQLDGRNIDVKAKAVHARGGFRYLQPANDEPWLGILAGISTDAVSYTHLDVYKRQGKRLFTLPGLIREYA